MSNIIKQLGKDPRQPTIELDSDFSSYIYPGLRALFKDVHSQGGNDSRNFEKNYVVEMIPSNLSETIQSQVAASVKDIVRDMIHPSESKPADMGLSESDHLKNKQKRAMELINNIENDDNDDNNDNNDNNYSDGKMESDDGLIPNSSSNLVSKLAESSLATQLSDIGKMLEFKYSDDIPKCLQELTQHIRQQLKINDDAPCNIYTGLFMRRSKMIAPVPHQKTISRVLLNFNEKDVYSLIEPYSGKGRPTVIREICLQKNMMMLLGPAGICGFNILVNNDPKFRIPGEMPPGIPGMGASNKERFSIRPNKYERLTIIIDFLASKKMSMQLSKGETDDLQNPGPALQELVGKVAASTLKGDSGNIGENGDVNNREGNDKNHTKGNGMDIPDSIKNQMTRSNKVMRKAKRRQARNSKKNQNNQFIDIDKRMEDISNMKKDEDMKHSLKEREIELEREREQEEIRKNLEVCNDSEDDDELDEIMSMARNSKRSSLPQQKQQS